MKRYFGSGPLFGMFMLWASRLFFFTALSACAATPQLVDHAFTFDVISDSPDIELLDYRYGHIRVGPAQAADIGRKACQIAVIQTLSGAFL